MLGNEGSLLGDISCIRIGRVVHLRQFDEVLDDTSNGPKDCKEQGTNIDATVADERNPRMDEIPRGLCHGTCRFPSESELAVRERGCAVKDWCHGASNKADFEQGLKASAHPFFDLKEYKVDPFHE